MNWIVRIIALMAVVIGLSGQNEALAQQGCGGENMRPCTVTERIPSCNLNLVEGGGLCVRPDCGRDGQRECSVVERMSTGVGTGTIAGPFPCDVNLKPSGTGFCVAVPCGKEGGQACAIWDRLPSCDANLVEVAGRCVHPQCGRDGQRPCSAIERRANACDFNLAARREPTGIFCRAPGIAYGAPSQSNPVNTVPPAPTAPPTATAPPPPPPPPPPRPTQGFTPVNPMLTVPPTPVEAPLEKRTTANAAFAANTDRLGGDIYGFPMSGTDPAMCQAVCNAHGECKSWTFVKPGIKGPAAQCFLKNTVPAPTPNNCCTSGAKQSAAR